jgi:tetratricopeptide (TPR) repeat protein
MLATVHERSGDFESAETVAREALALDPIPDAAADPWRSAALDTLGRALHGQGRFREAQAAYEELMPEARAFYGDDNVVVAQMVIDHSSVRLALGETEGLSDSLAGAYATMKRGLGMEHRKTLGALARLTDCLQLDGRIDEATALLREALDDLGERPAGDGSTAVPVLYRLAQCSLARDDREGAEASLRRACELSTAVGAEDRATLDVMLARTLLGGPPRLGEAAELARSGAASNVRSTRSLARFVLASVAAAEERLDDAESELRAALESGQPDRIWPESACQVLLGELLVRRGETGEGCGSLRDGLRALERSLGPGHFEVRDARARLERSGAAAECGLGEPEPAPSNPSEER